MRGETWGFGLFLVSGISFREMSAGFRGATPGCWAGRPFASGWRHASSRSEVERVSDALRALYQMYAGIVMQG